MSTNDNYEEILRLIPREPQMDIILDLTVEESNAVQWANAYYYQLNSTLEAVVSAEATESLESLCEQIQKLIPTIHPHDPTEDFLNIYGNNPQMCRSYNYFNQKITEMLEKRELTRATTILKSSDTRVDTRVDASVDSSVDSSVDASVDASVDTSKVSLDTLVLALFKAENTRLDPLALKLFESEKTGLDPLALKLFESEKTLLDKLALQEYRKP